MSLVKVPRPVPAPAELLHQGKDPCLGEVAASTPAELLHQEKDPYLGEAAPASQASMVLRLHKNVKGGRITLPGEGGPSLR